MTRISSSSRAACKYTGSLGRSNVWRAKYEAMDVERSNLIHRHTQQAGLSSASDWSTRTAKSEACIPTISALSLHNASTKSLNANASTNQRVFEWPSSLDLDVRERALVSRPAVRMTSICSLRFRSLRRLRQTAHPRGWSRLRTIKRPRLGDAGLHNVEVLWRCCIILG
jgi:hypothetical protein